MSMPARVALLLLLTLGFVRLTAAEPEEVASMRAKAEKGNALAQYNLGLVYAEGRLVPADLSEAFVWLSLASESGTTGKGLDSVLGSITDAQLTEGRRRLGVYRTALAAKNAATATSHTSAPKLAPRGFTVVAPPPTEPSTTEPQTVTPVKTPEAAAVPITTSPAEGSDASELAQSRKDLEKTRAELLAANTELATLRASVASLQAAATEAKATEARLTAELNAARHELETLKPVATATPVEKPKAADPAPPRS